MRRLPTCVCGKAQARHEFEVAIAYMCRTGSGAARLYFCSYVCMQRAMDEFIVKNDTFLKED